MRVKYDPSSEPLHIVVVRLRTLRQGYQRDPDGKLSILPTHTYSLRSLTAKCALLFVPAAVIA